MASVAEDIASFLALNNLGIEATNLFVFFWNSTAPDNAILVKEISGGPPPERFIGDSSIIKEIPITILIRNLDIFTAKSNAQAVYDLLDNAVIPGYVSVLCDQSNPNCIDKEETEAGSGSFRYYFSINVTCKKVE